MAFSYFSSFFGSLEIDCIPFGSFTEVVSFYILDVLEFGKRIIGFIQLFIRGERDQIFHELLLLMSLDIFSQMVNNVLAFAFFMEDLVHTFPHIDHLLLDLHRN